MKILIDATLPRSLEKVPNAEGVVVHRVDGGLSDKDLLRQAADGGYRAVFLLEAHMAATTELVRQAEAQGTALLCSVTDDPFEAEANFRHAIETLSGALAEAGGGVWWLRRDGLHRGT